MNEPVPIRKRDVVFVTHAAPQDNEFALWLSSKLAIAGYRVWIDRRRLRGGDDSWDEIDRILRHEAIKQIVVFTKHVSKPGVKKELAIGDVMKGKLSDPQFMIGVRNDDTLFTDAPPELLRQNILDAHPNWHDCLSGVFEALDDANTPRFASPHADVLRQLVEAREDGRRFVVETPEQALTNWFPVTPPQRIRYYRFEGLQEQLKSWLADCSIPCVEMGRLVGSFADADSFAKSSSFEQQTPVAYDLRLDEFLSGDTLGPYLDRSSASRDVASLMRQHFERLAIARGLTPVEFANGQTGFFFRDELLGGNKIVCDAPDGRRVRRSVSGKFKSLRWHLCLIAKPRIWPNLIFRIHANVVLSEDGRTPLAGDKTHKRRRRLTKSWWNNVWRDRLIASMSFLAEGSPDIKLRAGKEYFSLSTWPLLANVPVSYEASDSPLPNEEDENGNIVLTSALDDQMDDFGDDDGGEKNDDAGENNEVAP